MKKTTDRIHIGEPNLICCDKDMPITLDGTMIPLKNSDGTWRFITCDLCKKPYHHKFIGTPDNIFQKHEYCDMDSNGYMDEFPCGIWPWSAYKCEDGMIFCLCHREMISRTDPMFKNAYFIGIAVSYDNGDNWKYLGDIIGTPGNGTSNPWAANIGGIPIFEKDGFLYMYFNDTNADNNLRWISAARMNLSEAIEAIRNEKLPKVKKFSGTGKWETDPMTEMGANILPEVTGFYPDSHGCGVYIRPLNKFMLTLQSNGIGKLMAFFTEDGEHFTEYLLIDEVENSNNNIMQPYAFCISTDGDCTDDMRETGSEFYMYYPHKGCGDKYEYDDLYRRKITITD